MMRPRLVRLRQVSRCVVYAVRLSGRLLSLRALMWRAIAALKRQSFDLIARTWCIGSTPSSDGRDFYYGDIQQRLAARGIRLLLLCGNVRDEHTRAFARGHMATSPPCRLPELCLVPMLAPLRMLGQQLRCAWRLRRMAGQTRDPLMREILALASRDCLAPDTTLTGLVFWIGQAAVRTWRPKAFITLYEGQAWESCLRWGVKSAQSTCRTVGYQHTVLLPVNLALLRPRDEVPPHDARPDVVLCLGPRTLEMLTPAHPRSRLVVFGTIRQWPAPERCDKPRPRQRTVLVLPETGLMAEAQALFQFAMQAARRLPDHRFLFRCHPIMPFERVRPFLRWAPEEHRNIEVSDGRPIVDDFARASVVLARGSSSVLYAVLHGVKPIYVHDDRLRDGNPLSELTTWREEVSSPDALERTLRDFAATSEDALVESWRAAVRYIHTYTTPVSDASISRLMHAAGLSAGTR
jgi:hypothetical protein